MSREKEILREISRANFRKQKSRNVIAVIAIFLTTILITGTMSVGFSFKDAWEGFNDLADGPGADGRISGKEEQLSRIKERADVDWASLVYKGSAEPVIVPKYIGGMIIELRSSENLYYEKNGIRLLNGTYPKGDKEILISDTLAKELELDLRQDNSLKLKYYVNRDEKTAEEEMEFHICGYYKNPLAGIANVYEEIYCSRSFIENYNPGLFHENQNIYVKLKEDVSREKAYEILQDINSETGGDGVAMKMGSTGSAGKLAAAVAVALMVMSAAYLIIYNIFYISLVNDIRFYGTLKTLGTTGRQIRTVLNRQMWALTLPSLILGLISGNLLGRRLAPYLLSSFADNLNYVRNSKNILFVSLIGGCITIITVLSGCSRSFYTVSRISPVEAAHYGGKKCGRLFSRLSLGLSIIIFLLVFTVAGSQDARKEAKRYHTTDFTIENRSVHPLSESSYSPIDREVCGALKRAGFVETMDVCYNARSLPDYVTEENGEKTYDLTARVRPDEKIERESNEVARLYGEDNAKITYKGDWKMPLMGIPGSVLTREMKGKEVADGMIDEEEFAKGNYIIYQRYYDGLDKEKSVNKENLVKAGDKLTFSFYNNLTGGYDDREFTVMAVIQDGPGHEYSPSVIDINTLIISDAMFKEIYPDWQDMISVIKINTDNADNYAGQEEEIKKILGGYGGATARLSSIYDSTLHAKKNKEMILLIGGFFSVFFALIGIVNVLNTFVTEVMSRRIEYGRMQAVGMTNRQLYFHLVRGNLSMCLGGVVLGVPAAAATSKAVSNNHLFTGMKWRLFLEGSFLSVIILLVISCVTSLCLVKFLNRRSIAERLRCDE